ncbi:MAG TPA: aconitate hydratase B, partial [Gammaproteobacteria bacterium]|nr:aconitate hydratase B [Gammaproteobacteria bacterium]
MLESYKKHVEERAAEGVVPKPLDPQQVADLVELLKSPPAGQEEFLLDLITQRVPPGVDQAAYVKAAFLNDIVSGKTSSPLIDKLHAIKLLGTMQGGYNIEPLVRALDDETLAPASVAALSKTLLVFDAFHDVKEKMDAGNPYAKQIVESWANAEWFTSRPGIPEKKTVCVFKVTGETNTDDLSPAQDAWSRTDIPLHAQAMLKNPRPGITNALEQIEELKQKGYTLAYVGDVVGTGSSRKSATNS